MPESEAITRSIRIRVESRYIPERSDPSEKRWFFVYHVTIANTGEETIQLVSRHWIITDSDGNVEEVKARGAYVIAVATEGDEAVETLADRLIAVPEIYEPLTPILAVVPLQLLAYHVAVARGCDVDQPRNLAKSVTVE